MKFINLILAVLLFFVGCSKDGDFEPALTVSSTNETQADLNKQILADMPKALLQEIPEREQAEAGAGRLFVWYLKGQGDFPNPAGRCAPLLSVNITGTGIGTTIGRFTDEQSHCLNPDTFEFTQGFANFVSAKTGEQLFLSYWGVLTPTSDPAVFKIKGNTTLDSGTGTYEGATGQGSAYGTLNVATGEAELVGIGTLMFE